jgi:hypothetical protein
MIHHISLPVEDPLHVAQVLAELLNGKVAPFPSNPNSYIVVAVDAYGTMIELYPAGTELMPGCSTSPVTFSQNAFASPFTAVHAAISVPASETQIAEVGEREGWHTVRCDRGPFHVIEFWIENKLMLELLPAAFAAQYLKFMEPENLAQIFAGASVPRPAAITV